MRKILVVEDEERIRKMYKTLLTSEGYQVLEAQNACDARELLKIEDIDLVLLDIKMGTINGNILYDVIQSFHKTCKVIISSVYPLAEQKKIIPGALDYFDKAQGIDVLLGKIKNALQM